jgi:dTDP-4-dehydrorhamnose 3,5-epimerase-like enzyme
MCQVHYRHTVKGEGGYMRRMKGSRYGRARDVTPQSSCFGCKVLMIMGKQSLGLRVKGVG